MGFKRCAIVHAHSKGHDRNMKFKQAFFILFSICWLPFAAQAAVVKHMYEVSLPVVSQDKQIRKAAFEQAFIETLVRVSGSGLAPTEVDISKASRYVQQYRYLPLDKAMQNPPAASGAAEVQPQHLLWIQFNSRAIKKLLRQNNLPIWGQQRPAVLVWLAVRDGPSRYVLRQQDKSPIKEAVETEARRRGLPLIWPAYDKKDQAELAFVDLWGGFWGPVKKASARYGVDAILLGRMSWLGGQWQVSWSLQQGKQPVENWQLRAIDLNMLMAGGIDMATDQIASRFAVRDSGMDEGPLVVQVKGIHQLDDYVRSSRYLASLAPVKYIYAKQVNRDEVQFAVELRAEKEDLQRVIGLGRTLLPLPPTDTATDTASSINQLSYRLQP